VRLPPFAAVVGFALGEAIAAMAAAFGAERGFLDAMLCAVGAFAVVVAALLPPVWLLDRALDATGARVLTRGLDDALTGAGSAALGWLLGVLALGAAGTAAFAIAPAYFDHMSPEFARAATVVTSITLAAVMLLAAVALRPFSSRVRPVSARALLLDRMLAPLAAGAALAVVVGVVAGGRYSLAVAFGTAALAATIVRPWPVHDLRRAAVVSMLASALLVALLERFPPAVAEVLVYRTPYASLALGLGQRVVDRDRDGASPYLLGGDCDDRDARVHPDARDVPDNDVDENCSGKDAHAYRLPRDARSEGALPEPHDLVVLFVDALRPDRLSIAGYPRKTSPQLDALARESVWFRRAYTTAPSTRFAMASLFTGRDVRRLRHKSRGGNEFELLPGATTVASRLGKAGYQTTGYTVTYVVQHNRGTGQGFSTWQTPWPLSQWRTVGARKAAITTKSVLETLAKTPPEQRLFLFAHYYCAHDPFAKYPGYDFGDRPSDLYDSGVAHCDAQVGRVLDALRERPSWNRTAVFVVSDHGELFGEHGLKSHGNSLYEPDVRVVMLARVPGAAPRVVDDPVQLHWVAPTVLELAGLRPHKDDDAASLLGTLLRGEAPPKRPLFMFTELERGSMRYSASAVLKWPHKLIRDHRSRTLELYDVAADPGEHRSLAYERPELAGKLSDLLEAYEAWARPPRK
jgi:arylsulfatase A-like enzyme